MKKVLFLASLVVAVFALFLSFGIAQAEDSVPSVAVAASQDVTGTVEAEAVQPMTVTVPFLDEWMGSAHADATAEAFRHWDADDPAEIPANCAKCHSSTGYQDYVGADGSAVNAIDATAVAPGTVVDCVACHNSGTIAKTSVIMPSGIEITGLGDESRCMECHQGRESKVSVDAFIEEAGATEALDTVNEDLGFRNIHYFAAAATKYGTLAKGGYEYEGKTYDGNFMHVDGYSTCKDCHNPHTLELAIEECATCHEGVAAVEDLRNIRMEGSQMDYDGDGDVEEGIAFEIAGLQEVLLASIQAYANEVGEAAIAYNAHTHPYFMSDANANGQADEDEGDRYASWTPRLLKAAYNYQTSMKDPGAYAHGGKYIIELLFDSIEDLNGAIATPVDQTAMRRIDSGHFAGSEEAFRHWDPEGAVPGSCAKCHSASGLPTFIAEAVNVSVTPSNGLECSTCHNDLQEFTFHEVESVKFPSGAEVSAEEPETNLCLSCHQGRESGVSVDRAIGDAEPDAVTEGLSFRNPHYFAAGATMFGSEVNGMYQYEGKEYAGFNNHAGTNQCADCHNAHKLEVDAEVCAECHDDDASLESIENIRDEFVDYDGDGDDTEGVYFEEQQMLENLLAAIQTYAADTAGMAIAYSPTIYPYFVADTNGNGEVDPDEGTRENAYKNWTPRLLRAAYNYQWAQKDPGSFAHNGQYVLQALYDSLEDIGFDVSTMTRPAVED